MSDSNLYVALENFIFRGKMRKTGETLNIAPHKVAGLEGKIRPLTSSDVTLNNPMNPETTTPEVVVTPEAPEVLTADVSTETAPAEAPVV